MSYLNNLTLNNDFTPIALIIIGFALLGLVITYLLEIRYFLKAKG